MEERSGGATVPCRMLENGTVVCERYVYSSVRQWQEQKDAIDRMLKLYTDKIHFLKVNKCYWDLI